MMDFHPLCKEYTVLPDEELDRMAANMRAHGFAVYLPILRLNGQILDGRNRFLAAGRAGVPPVYHDLPDDTDPETVVGLCNDDRRHETPETVRARRQARVGRVAAKKRSGMSTRQIAEEEGVSQSQVVADLRAATEQGCSVDPPDGKVTGADGKTRPARRPTEQGCSVQDLSGSSEQGCSVEVAVEPPVLVDAWDIPVQPHAARAFAAVPKFKELMAAIREARRLFDEVASQDGGQFLTLPDVASYRRTGKGQEGEPVGRWVHPGLEQALSQVKNAVPAHTVCPWDHVEVGHPEDCRTCLNLRWTPPLSESSEVAREAARRAYGV